MINKLKPENVLKYGDGQYTNAPKVITKALDKNPSFTFYDQTGLAAHIHLCETCAATLDWTNTNRRGEVEHNWNGVYRVQYGEDQYMEGHYFRDYPDTQPIAIDKCDACKAETIQGYGYKLDIDEIDYGSDCIFEVEPGTRVVVLGIHGKVTGWSDSRPAKRRYHITFDNGMKASFLNWQMQKETDKLGK